MKNVLTSVMGRATDLAQTQPLLALCLGAALLALFVSLWRQRQRPPENSTSLAWNLYAGARRLLFALIIVFVVAQSFGVLRTYLRRSVAHFQQTHGRITEANYNAVQTIWGAEQVQHELTLRVYYDEEVTERTEFEDPTKPAILRKKMQRRHIAGNPFVTAAHEITLRQNPRKKGSALYGGYETDCRYTWKLKSPADRETRGTIRFPLPAQGAVYDALAVTVNGEDVLPKVELSEAALMLTRDLKPHEELSVAISFKSRGMSYWYFQLQEQREIRDFSLTLNLPDLPFAKLNYPEGCMSPTESKSTADGRGSVLAYRLDHAISQKGMGVSLPQLPQPGASTNAVLAEAERGWMLIASILLLTLTLAELRNAALASVMISAGVALAFGALANFSDLLFGFWGTASLVFLPALLVMVFLLRRLVKGTRGVLLAALILVFGLLYPTAGGLDPERQNLYLNICGFLFLAFAAWQLADELRTPSVEPSGSTQPAQ